MRIIFDNIIFSLQNAGGISVFWYEIIKRALNDNEIEPIFLEYPNKNNFRQLIEIRQKNILNSNSKIPLSILRYFNPKIRNETGIFHSSYYRTAKSSTLSNITTIHDFTYEYYRKGPAKYVHAWQKEKAIKNSDLIVCVSENTKEDLLKFNPDINEQKIRIVYNGVSNAYQIINSEKYLKDLITFRKSEYALYIGDRKSQYKNFHLATKACKKTNTPLVIIGGGQLSKTEFSFLNLTLGKANYIHLTGIENNILNVLYNNALCLLYPSLYEGFGIPVVEAQKAGCPVIAVNRASIPEIIGPVSTLINNPSIDSISEMIKQLKNNTEFVNIQIEIGLKNANRFSWDKCYYDTKRVYKEFYDKFC